jgi:FMN-dependent NADH-azoreductase
MSALLYLQASPRKDRSRSREVADAFAAAWRLVKPTHHVVTIDLFRKHLPAFDGQVLEAKYAILHGQKATPEQTIAWKAVEAVITEFTSADKYLLAAPMWNFGPPYRLKQYIDLLVQPTYTFSFAPDRGYSGLVTGKPLLIVQASGGQYEGDLAGLDHERPYLERIFRFIGFTDIRWITVAPTLMAGAETADRKVRQAVEQAREMAKAF